MNKKIIYAALIVLFIVLTVLVALSFKEKTGKIQIEAGGEQIKIADIYKNPAEKFSDTDVEFKRTDDYSFDYYAENNSFLIIITNNDVEAVQKTAEEDFLKTLDINTKQACKLNVKITIPYGINPEMAGQDFNLSFCADKK